LPDQTASPAALLAYLGNHDEQLTAVFDALNQLPEPFAGRGSCAGAAKDRLSSRAGTNRLRVNFGGAAELIFLHRGLPALSPIKQQSMGNLSASLYHSSTLSPSPSRFRLECLDVSPSQDHVRRADGIEEN
jgi:hypothetical protein